MMETFPLYMRDCYLKEWTTTVRSAKEKFIVLEETAFYPNTGGQPFDIGTIKTRDGRAFDVVFVGKFGGDISHEVDKEGLKEGDEVECQLDWARRHLHMRYHTACHVLSGIIHKETGAMITGSQIGGEKTRIDFSLEKIDREQIKRFEHEANQVVKRGLEVRTLVMSREELMKDPALVKLGKGMAPDIQTFRIVEIKGFDSQPCGGTHIRNTGEIGKITVTDLDNKGKNNRRVYFTLADAE